MLSKAVRMAVRLWNIRYDALVNYLLTLKVKVYLNIFLLSIKRVTSGRGQYQ